MNITKHPSSIKINFLAVKDGHINTAEIYIHKANSGKGYQITFRACDFPELENFSAENWNAVKNKIQAHEKDVEIFRQSLETVWKNILEVIQ